MADATVAANTSKEFAGANGGGFDRVVRGIVEA